jgi:hypothetical protein
MKTTLPRFSARPGGTGCHGAIPFKKISFALGVLLAVSDVKANAQGFIVSSQMTEVAVSRQSSDCSITLNNGTGSIHSVGTFWFAWLPGEGDFMLSEPVNVQAPAGWTYTITNGGPLDGYGIEFEAMGAGLSPGASAKFSFTTSDSFSVMTGTSSFRPGTPVCSSTVYSGNTGTGALENFVVPVVVPEVSTGFMIGSGLGILAWARRATKRA